MAQAVERRCRYCGGLLGRRQGSILLSEADSSGNFAYCPDSPFSKHQATVVSGTAVPDPAEARLRANMRRIAEDGQKISAMISEQDAALDVIRGKLKYGPWRDGTCQRCGTQTLVVGPVVQPLCVYCDELRILPPLPPEQRKEKTLVRPARHAPVRQVRVRLSLALVLAGLALLLGGADLQVLAVCCFVWSIGVSWHS